MGEEGVAGSVEARFIRFREPSRNQGKLGTRLGTTATKNPPRPVSRALDTKHVLSANFEMSTTALLLITAVAVA